MSLADCITRAVRAGLMDPKRAEFARKLFDEKYDYAKLNLGSSEAHAQARADTIDQIARMMAQIRREKLLQAQASKDIIMRAAQSGAPLDRAMTAHIDFDPGLQSIPNIAKRRDTIRGILHENMGDFLSKFRRDLLGRTRNVDDLVKVLHELHGQRTGDEVSRNMAQAFADTAERARKMFNKAGGNIAKLEGWALPHSHDTLKVRAAGFDSWFAKLRQRVDLAKMADGNTGRPFTEADFRRAAENAYREISTEGWANRELGQAYGSKLSRSRMDHRFFVFKSAEDWLAYHEEFGRGDVFSVMMGHLDGMARDISLLQVLGPNPTAQIRWMGDVIERNLRLEAMKTGAPTDALESQARRARRALQTMYETYTGANNAPIDGRIARTFAGTRSVLQSAQLGAAALSAVSDLSFQKMASGELGIPMRKIMGRYLSLLNPLDEADKKVAIRLGLIADDWINLAVAQQRYLGEVTGPEITQRLADLTMRVSGLSPWTQAGRWAFGMEFAGLLADNADVAFKDLPEKLSRAFERYNISEADWNIARRTAPLIHKGASFLRPDDIADEATAFKFLDMLHTETEFAVPSSSLRGRSLLIGEAPPGTVQGELVRSFAMYKNFGVTLAMTHFRRALAMPTRYEQGRYLAQFALSTSLMGGLALQLKEIAKGRDPRPMDSAAFWAAASLQGGGFGIFGDFLFSQKNRYDKGLASTIAGPVFGAAGDVLGYVNENVSRAYEGEDTRIAAGALDLAARYAPLTSLWYARAGAENLVFDELRRLADPKTTARLRRIERRFKREYGQDYWWKRSNNEIRPPDLAAAFGD